MKTTIMFPNCPLKKCVNRKATRDADDFRHGEHRRAKLPLDGSTFHLSFDIERPSHPLCFSSMVSFVKGYGPTYPKTVSHHRVPRFTAAINLNTY